MSGVQYTLRRIKKDDSMYGQSHGSRDAQQTLCGIAINENWFVVNNTSDGEMTCRKCLRSLDADAKEKN